MSGTWYDPNGTPRDPNEGTSGDDSYRGTDGADSTSNEFGLPFVITGGGNDTLDLLGGNDSVAANEGDNVIYGGEGDDYLQAGLDNDVLDGGAGDDFLSAQPGDDTMYGGSGSDTVLFRGVLEGYRITSLPGGGWQVVDITPEGADGDDGSDLVGGDVEFFQFENPDDPSNPTILPPPCFTAGTRIMTVRGEVPVETLRAGDMVVTLGLCGPGLRPVRWVGHRVVDCRRHPRPDAVVPVRILAGALGEGVPRRDLVVSPDHALYLEGALIPAAALVDGHGVRRDRGVGRVRYYHVELDAHDVLLAEGTPAESWLDCGNRDQFDNGGLIVALHPDFTTAPAQPGCARRLADGPALDRVLLRLAARRPAAVAALLRHA